MKILVKTYTDTYDYIDFHKLIINGELKETIGRCEPEDAIIGRDLIDAHQICSYMEMAYEAGKNGEELNVEFKEIKNKDDFWD